MADEMVAYYMPVVVSLAKRRTGKYGAELDDLVQEGLIAVWLALDHQEPVTEERIVRRMRNWIRYARSAGPIERLWPDVH